MKGRVRVKGVKWSGSEGEVGVTGLNGVEVKGLNGVGVKGFKWSGSEGVKWSESKRG